MHTAHVDTPWGVGPDGEFVPQLAIDPSFASDITKWSDVTGAEGVEVEPGRVLHGGNYAKASGIQPDHSQGRVGGSGDPDWLMIEITFDEVAHPTLLDDIDAVEDYNVYSSELIVEEETP